MIDAAMLELMILAFAFLFCLAMTVYLVQFDAIEHIKRAIKWFRRHVRKEIKNES